MNPSIGDKTIFQIEWNKGWSFLNQGNISEAKMAFEKAHYQGQFFVTHHFLAHYAKFRISIAENKTSGIALNIFLMMIAPISRIIYLFFLIKVFLPMHFELKIKFEEEMATAKKHYSLKNYDKALKHLGTAHILGSHFCFAHMRTHFNMMKIEWKLHHYKGVCIQFLRTIGSIGTRLVISFIGVTGNTGLSKYPAGTRYPVAEDLKPFLKNQGLKI